MIVFLGFFVLFYVDLLTGFALSLFHSIEYIFIIYTVAELFGDQWGL